MMNLYSLLMTGWSFVLYRGLYVPKKRLASKGSLLSPRLATYNLQFSFDELAIQLKTLDKDVLDE